ncbi:MAG: M15 family metallopeptidase [Terrisporobacter sp.]
MKKNILITLVILTTITLIGRGSLLTGLCNNKNDYIEKETRSEASYLMLANKDNPLDTNYKPDNMVKPKIQFLKNSTNEEKQMTKEAAIAIGELFKSAKNDNIKLIGTSAYRSYRTQISIFNKNVKEKGVDYANNYVALPGKSEHQTGLAIDVTNESRCFDKTSIEAQWLANNAHKFGFILRYPEGKEDITGYNYEPWHVRYVGKVVAAEIYKNNWTLEEYLEINN